MNYRRSEIPSALSGIHTYKKTRQYEAAIINVRQKKGILSKNLTI